MGPARDGDVRAGGMEGRGMVGDLGNGVGVGVGSSDECRYKPQHKDKL